MLIKSLIPNLNSRSYERDRQEADDLIFAFCKVQLQHYI